LVWAFDAMQGSAPEAFVDRKEIGLGNSLAAQNSN
jgi:hypothetical protein